MTFGKIPPSSLLQIQSYLFLLTERVYRYVVSDQQDFQSVRVSLDSFESQIDRLDEDSLNLLHLEIIKLLCLIPDDTHLLAHMPNLLVHFDTQSRILLRDQGLEEIKKELLVYEKGRLMDFQSSLLSLEARGLEFRFRLMSSVERVMRDFCEFGVLE